MSRVARVQFVRYEHSIAQALDLIGAGDRLPQKGLIILKPNLTNSAPPPVTTSVQAVEAVYRYCRAHTSAEIVIGEGAGSGRTPDVFGALGYADFAQREGLRLIDFNEAETVDASESRRPAMEGVPPAQDRPGGVPHLDPGAQGPQLHEDDDCDEEHVRPGPGPTLRRHVEQGETPLALRSTTPSWTFACTSGPICRSWMPASP